MLQKNGIRTILIISIKRNNMATIKKAQNGKKVKPAVDSNSVYSQRFVKAIDDINKKKLKPESSERKKLEGVMDKAAKDKERFNKKQQFEYSKKAPSKQKSGGKLKKK